MGSEAGIVDMLRTVAWAVREHSKESTQVGAALMSSSGQVFAGINIGHHDLHAEVAAISQMLTLGDEYFTHIVICCPRANFSPCGSCRDWINKYGGTECKVYHDDGQDVRFWTAQLLFPFPPARQGDR